MRPRSKLSGASLGTRSEGEASGGGRGTEVGVGGRGVGCGDVGAMRPRGKPPRTRRGPSTCRCPTPMRKTTGATTATDATVGGVVPGPTVTTGATTTSTEAATLGGCTNGWECRASAPTRKRPRTTRCWTGRGTTNAATVGTETSRTRAPTAVATFWVRTTLVTATTYHIPTSAVWTTGVPDTSWRTASRTARGPRAGTETRARRTRQRRTTCRVPRPYGRAREPTTDTARATPTTDRRTSTADARPTWARVRRTRRRAPGPPHR